VHGYPRLLAYGNNAIYQIGSVVTNNNLGTYSAMITRIPLLGDATTFVPPTNLTALSSADLDICAKQLPSNAYTTFYSDTLYLFCSVNDAESANEETDLLVQF
jgi:hypothetical protein